MNFLSIVHALMGLLAIPFIALMMSGCLGIEDKPQPFDLGSEAAKEDVIAALDAPLATMNPFEIEVGQFVFKSITQDLGGGTSRQVLQDSGLTIVERTATSDHVAFRAILHTFTYDSDGHATKVSKEIPLCAEAVEGACGTGEDASQAGVESLAQLKARLKGVSQNAGKVTYHKLRTSMEVVDPPSMVKARANCGGLPNCKLRKYLVSFNEVYWEDGKPTSMTIEVAMSPDVPFFAGELQTCQQLLAPVGDSGHKVLLKQCSVVNDFRFREE